MHKFSFPGSDGSRLAARLDFPEEGAPVAFALFVHCFTGGKDIFGASRIARKLTEHQIAVMRFDFTGIGKSEGEFANTNFSSNVQDLVHAANHLRLKHKAPTLLIGHSFGGTACLKGAQQIPEARAVVTIGAPADTQHIQKQFWEHRDDILEQGEVEVMLAGRPFKLRRQFIEDVESHNIKDDIANLKRALLILHAPNDETVKVENAAKIFSLAKHPKSFISLDTADHLLTTPDEADYAADLIAAWCERYV